MRSSRAYQIYLIIDVGMSMLFGMIFASLEVFRVQHVGLLPLQLVLIGTVLELSCFILEVPTGVVADSYSRRASILLGVFLLGFSFLLQGLIPVFAAQLVFQVVAAFGYTFMSGAQQAWITDEIGEEAANKAFLRASQLGTLGSLVGIVSTMLLGSINVVIPIVLGGGLMMTLAAVMVFVMPEHGFKPTPRGERTSFQHMTGTFREGLKTVRGSRILITIILLSSVMGMFSESYDRMQGIHFLNTVGLPGQFSPVVWFGLMSIVAMPVHIFLTEIIRRRINTTSHHAVARTLMLLEGLLVVGVLIFAFAGSFWVAAGASIVIGLLRGLGGPLQAAWVNQNVASHVRATVFSMHSQANAIGQVVGGPVLGAVGNVSVRLALACGALLLMPNLLLYRRTLRQADRVNTDVAETPAEA